jgi:hypothetical protein
LNSSNTEFNLSAKWNCANYLYFKNVILENLPTILEDKENVSEKNCIIPSKNKVS